MALFDFSGILSAVQGFLGPFGKLIDHIKTAVSHLTNIIQDSEKLFSSIADEITGWKNFKQDIRLKQRVIQLESAIAKTKDLIEGIPAAWRSIVDIFKQLKETTTSQGDPAAEVESAVEDIESGGGGIKALLSKFPQLAKGLEKILGVAALIVQALETISNTITDLQTIVDELKRLRLEFEKLDTIFLSQSNKRKSLKLADGSTIRVRVGKLHHS